MPTLTDKPSPVPRTKPDDVDVDVTEPDTVSVDERSRRPFVLLALATLALIALAAVSALRVLDDRAADDLRDSAVDTASEHALTLLSVSSDNVDRTLDTLLDNSTGDFRRQFEGIRKTFGDVVRKGKVTSRGKVVSAAVAEVDETSARVLLALTATVTNSEAKKPEARQYRITVDLTRKEEQWLVSGMQFVP